MKIESLGRDVYDLMKKWRIDKMAEYLLMTESDMFFIIHTSMLKDECILEQLTTSKKTKIIWNNRTRPSAFDIKHLKKGDSVSTGNTKKENEPIITAGPFKSMWELGHKRF